MTKGWLTKTKDDSYCAMVMLYRLLRDLGIGEIGDCLPSTRRCLECPLYLDREWMNYHETHGI